MRQVTASELLASACFTTPMSADGAMLQRLRAAIFATFLAGCTRCRERRVSDRCQLFLQMQAIFSCRELSLVKLLVERRAFGVTSLRSASCIRRRGDRQPRPCCHAATIFIDAATPAFAAALLFFFALLPVNGAMRKADFNRRRPRLADGMTARWAQRRPCRTRLMADAKFICQLPHRVDGRAAYVRKFRRRHASSLADDRPPISRHFKEVGDRHFAAQRCRLRGKCRLYQISLASMPCCMIR